MARPEIIITDKQILQISQLAGYGLTLPQIASVIGISERELFRRKNDEKAVKAALDYGKAMAEARIGKSLFERALDGDVAAIRWWEMTRAKRSAEVKIEQQTEQRVVVATAPNWQALIGSPTDADAQ